MTTKLFFNMEENNIYIVIDVDAIHSFGKHLQSFVDKVKNNQVVSLLPNFIENNIKYRSTKSTNAIIILYLTFLMFEFLFKK